MQLSNIGTIKELMKRHDFSFSKSLGQNFLVNPTVCPKIAQNSAEGVIEIGTGFGVLTVELCKTAKKVVAIELDQKLLPVLDETLSEYSNVKIINADVLKVDMVKLIQEEFPEMTVAVCANLPYYITSPIIMSLLEQRLPIKSITVMVQKEAAERICAKMGTRECGALTAAVNYYANPTVLFQVSRGSFMPTPNVDSTVIRLDIKTPPAVKNEKLLFRVIKGAFSQRRKTMANPLCGVLSVKKELIVAAMEHAKIKSSARAEELSLEDFINLTNELGEVSG